jgi:uncharacterized protein (TIGR03032 family)
MTDVRRRIISTPQIAPAKPIELRVRGDFVDWLAHAGGSLAATTYNSGKLALLNAYRDDLVASFWRFPRPMGLAYSASSLAIASQQHIWMFAVEDEIQAPLRLQSTWTTRKVDAHDLAFDRRGLAFVNTRFNCIARPSNRVSLLRSWQPWFVEGVQAKDCCHLNGLGVRDGRIAMASAFCDRGAPAAWREADRFQSGVLIDVRRNVIAARGLCMPHSPRWHDSGWWFCDSGRGAFCRLDEAKGRWQEVAVLPGFTRGLAFAAGRALVGLSRIRKHHILDAPPVRQRFPRMRSGLWLVDPTTGRTTGSVEFVRGGREAYDVTFLPNLQQPNLVLTDRESAP